jgi:hypothetical protein
VIFTGVQEGDQYGITTSSDFNAFAVTSLPAGIGPVGNVSSTNSFDLGVFSIGQVDTGEPINLSFDLQLTDFDGDTIVVTDALEIQIDPAPAALTTLASFSAPANDEGSLSLLADNQESQKQAANSNTLTMAAAVAAAGVTDSAAASPTADVQSADNSEPQVFTTQVVEKAYADDGGEGGSAVAGAPEVEEADGGPANSGGHGNGNANGHDNQLDAGSNEPADGGSPKQAANDDDSPATADPQVAIAPTVMMASAAELLAADLEGGAKHNGVVEKIIVEALGDGATTVDALLNAIHGGNADGPQVAILASPTVADVSTWDMASNGGSSGSNEMLMKVGAEVLHHDMVQPTHNG